MTWLKIHSKNYQNQGLKCPVFFMPKQTSKRFFLDVKNGQVELEYSYDPVESYHPQGTDMQWQKLESGIIKNDFAFEMFGVNALRLRVLNVGSEEIDLQIFEKKANEHE